MLSMTSLPAVLALGCLLGMRHAMDPDHVVAVSTIVSRERGTKQARVPSRIESAVRAMRIGAMWGVGHSFMVLAVGVLMIVGRVVISPKVSAMLEMGVALMLVVLGVMNFRHEKHSHFEQSVQPTNERSMMWRSMMVGLVHGLAGSAAIALVVLASIRDVHTALLYLTLFAMGTIVGMASLTTVFSLSMVVAMRRFANLDSMLPRMTGVLSILCGFVVAGRIVF